ncbi:hypothetical protein [Halalkalibacillus halophilus]|uniref:hypothetical protein n=1 Tax=Halalkalibacillus halophilus TaxID=392827 RepID=UPI00042A1D40|nr:hypothetical protein [Halalkalibacillus halophilus]
MNWIIDYQWEVFIFIEVLSLIALLLFGFFRYYLARKSTSLLFIYLFLVFLIIEAALAMIVYQHTGEISTFQIVIVVFVIYALTFGLNDFKKLDRWMRKKVGEWRNIDLLTEKDRMIYERQKDPKHIAKVNRMSAMIHLIIFVIAQTIFWMMGTDSLDEAMSYLTDLSWFESGEYEDSPYPNETIYSIGMLWAVIFVVDFIYSWSYTIFPKSS